MRKTVKKIVKRKPWSKDEHSALRAAANSTHFHDTHVPVEEFFGPLSANIVDYDAHKFGRVFGL